MACIQLNETIKNGSQYGEYSEIASRFITSWYRDKQFFCDYLVFFCRKHLDGQSLVFLEELVDIVDNFASVLVGSGQVTDHNVQNLNTKQ